MCDSQPTVYGFLIYRHVYPDFIMKNILIMKFEMRWAADQYEDVILPV